MAQVPFTDREMQRAWRSNLQASLAFSKVARNNAHRLLLFYAIECGLKAVLMRRKSVTCTNHCEEIGEAQHDINKLLDALGAGNVLKLPNQFSMAAIKDKGSKQERKLESGKINQMWRYGGSVTSMDNSRNGRSESLTDDDLEKYLIEISKWIEMELAQS
jgi:hypothetical protein